MEKAIEITDASDTERKIYVADGAKEKIVTIGNDDDVLQANYEGRKEDGFDLTRSIRRVAHIDMGTVHLLAIHRKDADAMAYLHHHDTDARDRMIRRYPDLFKACSGGV